VDISADKRVSPSGPTAAKILIVGEAPGEEEVRQGLPFVGSSGQELTRILLEAGISREACRITNVCAFRPPANKIESWIETTKRPSNPSYKLHKGRWVHPHILEGCAQLEAEVTSCNPNVVVALGNTALWALTGKEGITKWRGSFLSCRLGTLEYKVIPTFHPASILRQWSQRWLAVHDLRKVPENAEYPQLPKTAESFIIRPNFAQAKFYLEMVLKEAKQGTWISADVETWDKQITCIALAWNDWMAICIPFYCLERLEGYWTQEEELEIIKLLVQILSLAKVVGQNFNYDARFIAKYWGVLPRVVMDTMLQHHVHFPGLQKDLGFLSSLYLPEDHVYWKDDGAAWDPRRANEDQYWTYNCRDASRTWRIAKELYDFNQTTEWRPTDYGTPPEIQHSMLPIVLEAELRGVLTSSKTRIQLIQELQNSICQRQEYINTLLKGNLNVRSPKQLHTLFYEELGQRVVVNRKTRRPTTDADALDIIASREPILRPLCNTINEIRSLSSSLGVCQQPIDSDGRVRTSFNIGGTETFRFSSGIDPFGMGTNLQNLTSGDEERDDYHPEFPVPNLRRLLIPDPGFTLGEFDLGQADARVVAWEAHDEGLMALFRDPSRDLHNENCELIFGRCTGPDDLNRQLAKIGVHLTNYGGTPPVLAVSLGITQLEAEKFQARWFGGHPAIREWHRKTLLELSSRRYVENAYGYKRFYFDRIEGILKEALAWIPQSTIAITTNIGVRAVRRDSFLMQEGVSFLLQVHDSAGFQWPTLQTHLLLPRLKQRMSVAIPYPEPLVIPVTVKISEKSWGDCKKVKDMVP